MLTKNLLSVLIPLYNEAEFVAASITRVLNTVLPGGLALEIVVVDDGSTDGSAEIVEELAAQHPGKIRLIRHPLNQGKGAAVRTALESARGEFGIIQDADLEYNPAEYPKLLQPILEGYADVVYGSRFMAAGERRVLYFWHSFANRLLTLMCNMAADLNLTDMETCYKAFRTSLLQSIPIRSNRFGIEPEITIKLAQRQACIYELPITYRGRTYEEGKKIGFKDALQAVLVILKYAVLRDTYRQHGPKILDTLAETHRFNKWMADTIRGYVGARVLELGAGIGNITRHLSPGRKLYAATDIDEEHLARLAVRFQDRPNLKLYACNLKEQVDFERFREQMDTVVCLNVLEHIDDDGAGLRNIYSALQPGGKAVILVPEGQSLFGTLDEVLGHYRRYSEHELRAKMEATGFRIESVLRFNRITRPGWFVNGRILKRQNFSRFQLFFFDRMVWLWRRIDNLLPWAPVSLIAIGVKER